MKVLIIARPGAMPPPADTIRAAREWINERLDDGTFECVYSFIEGGGFSVGEVESLEHLTDLMAEYPMGPFVQWEVHPLTELDAGFDRALAMVERVAAQMS